MRQTEGVFSFEHLDTADLVLDAVYQGGPEQTLAADPLARLLPCGNQGGFRAARVRPGGAWAMAVLFSSGEDPDWPDSLDPNTGLFTYYGDNKRPGKALHDTSRRGNALLRDSFEAVHGDQPRRETVPPFFVFTKGGTGRDIIFRGLAVPGSAGLSEVEDLVAVWRSAQGLRFQNYRAFFSVLDVAVIKRQWIESLKAGTPLSTDCPDAFAEWVSTGRYRTLQAPRTLAHRTREEQLPTTTDGWRVVRTIYERFKEKPAEFEKCAALLWQMMGGPGVADWELTRPTRDGGRDAIGHFALGPTADRILLDFALEAKCYQPGASGVGVRDTSRLISRLRHRQFGVLVTTSYVHSQAYEEIRDDVHPVIVFCAQDIVATLAEQGITTGAQTESWLGREFPAEA